MKKVALVLMAIIMAGCSSHIKTYVSHKVTPYPEFETGVVVNDLRSQQSVKSTGISDYHTNEIISEPPLKDLLKMRLSDKLKAHIKSGSKIEVNRIDAEFSFKNNFIKGSSEFKMMVEARFVSVDGEFSKIILSDVHEYDQPIGFKGVDFEKKYVEYSEKACVEIAEKILTFMNK